MPDKSKSDSPPVPAGREGRRANLVRLVIVVGLPLVTVFFRLPTWFTLLLMCVLAALLFFKPRLPKKGQPDPKQAWTLLMANFTRLQSACASLEKSPDDAEARRRFSMFEERCRSILNSYSDSAWGPNSEYAAKVKKEITALSASFGAEGRDPAPAPGREAVPPPEAEQPVPPAAAGQSESPLAALLDTPTSGMRLGPMSAGEPTFPQPGSPVLAVRPEVPTPAVQPGTPTASEAVAPQPESPAPAVSLEVPRAAGRRLTPYLWLPGSVEDAAAFYVSVFRNSRVVGINRYPEGLHAGTWSVQTATVCLDGQDLMLLNGGSAHSLPGSFQLLVRCADQAEVDYFWERLPAGGGEEGTGGWLKDRFGVSWQVVPDALLELLNDPDPQRVARATEAVFKMKKIDIAALHEAVGRPESFASPMPG